MRECNPSGSWCWCWDALGTLYRNERLPFIDELGERARSIDFEGQPRGRGRVGAGVEALGSEAAWRAARRA